MSGRLHRVGQSGIVLSPRSRKSVIQRDSRYQGGVISMKRGGLSCTAPCRCVSRVL